MKRFFAFLFFIFQLSIFNLLTSCDNPLFIGATGLYKVSFSVNGGSAVDSYRTSEIKEAPFTSRADYTFESWHKKSDFSDSAVSFPLEINEDTMLYAKWYQEFTVSFETNGGDEIESYKTGIIQAEPDTSRTNYIFAGWYTKSDFSGNPVNFPYTVTKPVTLYAKWLATYQVTFETNGGSEVAGYRTATIESAPETSRDGYTFVSWYRDSALTQTVGFPLTLTGDTTFYAKWQQIYKVTFVTNGGSAITSHQTGYIESSPVTTKTDASLEGWYTTADFAEGSKVAFPYTVTGDITLYAKWQAVQCTITYYANGATGGAVPESVSVDKGSSYAVSGNTGNLEKTGYAFTKWNTRADGEGQGYSAGNTMTVTGDVALYAQWGVDYGSWENDDLRSSMVYVAGGTFSQGGTHDVTLTQDFYLGKFEITYELWTEVRTWAASQETDWNVGSASKGVTTNDSYTDWEPATKVSWYEAVTWCNAYSEMKGLTPCYYSDSSYSTVYRDYSASGYVYWNKSSNGYRLPTESEWEYAAKGGPNQKSYTYAGSNTIGDVAWYSGTVGSETHPVGTKAANSLGIYDMCGNVREWCGTSYYSYSSDAQTNPNYWAYYTYSPVRFGDPIYRGGSWYGSATSVTSRSYGSYGTDENTYTGFRVARNAE
ncbi:MAG: InlB B-repeat-containing protein [Treponema sp.]|nr:InlB B-repeat-containing protein [Treponema sp.]